MKTYQNLTDEQLTEVFWLAFDNPYGQKPVIIDRSLMPQFILITQGDLTLNVDNYSGDFWCGRGQTADNLWAIVAMFLDWGVDYRKMSTLPNLLAANVDIPDR